MAYLVTPATWKIPFHEAYELNVSDNFLAGDTAPSSPDLLCSTRKGGVQCAVNFGSQAGLSWRIPAQKLAPLSTFSRSFRLGSRESHRSPAGIRHFFCRRGAGQGR
jgi:hypothetical protein